MQNGDLIHLKLRLLGGVNSPLKAKEIPEDDPISSPSTNMMREATEILSHIPEYFLGNEVPNLGDTPKDSSETTGDDLNDILTRILGDLAHVIHPNSLSANSIFNLNNDIADKAINSLVTQIFDRLAIHIENKENAYSEPPPLDKPVVSILNTGNAPDADNISPMGFHGSHWVSLIILPSNYVGYKDVHQKSQTKPLETPNRVYLFDSLPSAPHREIPFKLKQALCFGTMNLVEVEEKTHWEFTPPLIDQNSVFFSNTNKRQQTNTDNNCGFWAVANAIMVVNDGNDNLWHRLFASDTSEDDTKFNAGCFLRQQLNTFLDRPQTTSSNPQDSDSKVINDSPSPQELLPAYQSSDMSSTEETKSHTNDSTKSGNRTSVPLTKSGTPDHRFKTNKNQNQPSSRQKPRNLKRKSKEISSNNSKEDADNFPHNLSPTAFFNRKRIRSTAQEDQEMPPPSKVLVNFHESEHERRHLCEKIHELQEHIQASEEKDRVKEAQLQALLNDNNTLKEAYVEIINHQDNEAKKRDKQIESLEEENTRLKLQTTLIQREVTNLRQCSLDAPSEGDKKSQLITTNGKQPYNTNSQIKAESGFQNTESNKEKRERPQKSTRATYKAPNMEVETFRSNSPNRRVTVIFRSKDRHSKSQNHQRTLNQQSMAQSNQINPCTKSIKREDRVLIPWNGKIISPTPSQIKQFGGRLNDIYTKIGFRDAAGKELTWRGIRIPWKGKILKPTPSQLLAANGDLNVLSAVLNNHQGNKQTFHQNPSWNQENNFVSRYFKKHSK